MSENIYLIPFGIICVLVLFSIYILSQYVRDKIFYAKEHILGILILIEYLLLGFVVFSAISLPYQLSRNSLFCKLSTSRVMFNDIIYETLFIIFILISLTSFSSPRLSLKENFKSYMLFLVISIFSVIILSQINQYCFSIERIGSDALIYHAYTKQQHINEIFIGVLPSLIWLYFMSRFKENKATMFKKYIYNRLPIVIWYLVFSFIIIKPFLLSQDVINHLLNVLGAFG